MIAPCDVLSGTAEIGGLHRFSAVSLTEGVEVAVLKAESYDFVLKRISELKDSFLRHVSGALDTARERFFQCRMPVAERLMMVLKKFRGHAQVLPDGSFKLPLSFLELAHIAHTTPESVSRSLRKFEQQGLISLAKGRIRINHLP